MILFFRGLFRHKHKWVVTHTNKWGIPTRKVCKKCFCVATIETYKQEPPLTYRWEYSYKNGAVEVGERSDM